MELEHVPTIADALRAYFTVDELVGLCALFEISLDGETEATVYMALAKRLVTEIEHGNNRRFLEAVIPSAHNRAMEGIAKENFERRDAHRHWAERLGPLEAALGEKRLPSEVTVLADQPFTAKSQARELMGGADTEVTVVDNYVGHGTLDCLRDVKKPVRLLTGQLPASIGQGFEAALAEFRAEGHALEVRRHAKLHDRYVIFNDRCWLVGSSLKDAGRKAFSMIEIVDSKTIIVADVERKWTEATTFP